MSEPSAEYKVTAPKSIKKEFRRADAQALSTKTVYRGFLSVQEHTVKHRLYSGKWSAELKRECLHRGDSVAVLPYNPNTNQIILVEQFRVGALGDPDSPWLIELIAGMVDAEERPETAIRREAREEAGLVLTDLEVVSSCYPSAGGCSERVTVYLAPVWIDEKALPEYAGLADEGEDIRILCLDRDEAMAMIKEGKIRSATAIMAIQSLLIKGMINASVR